MGRRPNFSRSSLFNMLTAKEKKFVNVDHGTYGLKEWGLLKAEPYTEIVAVVLQTEGRTMTQALLNAVNQFRAVEPNSLAMLLDLNPRFYSSINGEFGLRAWLPERSKQTLRTPSWQVESSKSFERVKRAEERGYNVDAIVERDRRLSAD